ncbi:MAG: flavodoxin-dependent (E)-4-hydroxy-3-methylbut-2-enyl-diphosphate synthase [Acidobacteria bacterium]|nr:flavodoxin-dependent (E)-4-hydroxy-3-methylbut-2-enyl-diphosphate synthase [Acidobacteriota bacterium]MCA1636835.1 flavodoxin-dependent (E)-4-hydroxy-3-methylbut-2-enyl-diphosphate synthase [Acidobacteriota bacterium]
MRRKSKAVMVRNVQIGGDAPIAVQSMTKTDTAKVEETVKQIEEMVVAGCEIVRLAVKDEEDAIGLKEIRKRTNVPLVADIHYNYKMALMALDAGIDKLRLNPGNIGSIDRVREVVRATEAQGVPIRIGVNGGSLEKDLLKKYGTATPEAMVESGLRHVRILEDLGFSDIVISLKASDVQRTVAAYRLMSEKVDYPLHLGVTEAGTPFGGTIKSSIGLGILLHEGIGDTIRVSLAAEPHEEVRVGWEILKSLGLRQRGVTIVACPTCGRLDIDNFVEIVTEVERRLAHVEEPLHLSIMGCAVNGPGEAHDSQLGITFGRNVGMIFKNGVPMRRVSGADIVEEFVKEVEILRKEGANAKSLSADKPLVQILTK